MKQKIIGPTLVALWVLAIFSIVMILGNGDPDTGLIVNGETIVYGILTFAATVSILSYFWLRHVVSQIERPVKQLTEDAKHFNESEYVHQLRDYDVEELQELAFAFDYMGDELGSHIRKLKYQKEKLEGIISALEEGIIILDEEGKILESNGLAMQFMGLVEHTKIEGVILTHLFRDETFNKWLMDGLKQGKAETMEFQLGNLIVYMNMVAIGQRGIGYEYLLIIKDVTRLKALEEMKYQFVSNVSHEIKTPLTSIQGFVETLMNGAIENPKVAYKFLNIIDVEAKRLYRLIQDILTLSEIENMQPQHYEPVALDEVLEQVENLLCHEAEKKEVLLAFPSKTGIQVENMSRDHIQQLFMNLVSNAIKYTDHGQVTVSFEEREESYIFSVKDTGIGISEENITHLFERFYRVDKSRSRSSGGTGLGLSIVKHIAKLYEIEIEVESKLGEGSVFRLKFKR